MQQLKDAEGGKKQKQSSIGFWLRTCIRTA